MSKVDKHAQFKSCGVQIIQNLSAVFIHQFRKSLQLNYYFVVADKISFIPNFAFAKFALRAAPCYK